MQFIFTHTHLKILWENRKTENWNQIAANFVESRFGDFSLGRAWYRDGVGVIYVTKWFAIDSDKWNCKRTDLNIYREIFPPSRRFRNLSLALYTGLINLACFLRASFFFFFFCSALPTLLTPAPFHSCHSSRKRWNWLGVLLSGRTLHSSIKSYCNLFVPLTLTLTHDDDDDDDDENP